MITADDLTLLHDLLGRPIYIGKRLLMVSSVNPTANRMILHSATDGERLAMSVTEFVQLYRTVGHESEEPFPDMAVISQPGVKAEQARLGPRGGRKW